MKRFTLSLAVLLVAGLPAFSQSSPQQEEDPRPVHKVRTTLEFLRALGSGRIVEVEDSVTLLLTPALEDEYICSGLGVRQVREGRVLLRPGLFSEEVSGSRQLVLSKMSNLTIRGKATIQASCGNAFVLKFSECLGLVLENLTLTHTDEGPSQGGVLSVEGGGGITLDGCRIIGHGGCAVQGQFFDRLSLRKTSISGCSDKALLLQDAGEVELDGCNIIPKN